MVKKNWHNWRWQLQKAVNSPDGLASTLAFSGKMLRSIHEVSEVYPVFATPYYLSLANPENPDDPVLRQCVPCVDEIVSEQWREPDPFNEQGACAVPFLIHRYRNRVVCSVTGRCAVRCRHCTRKNTLETKRRRTCSEQEAMLSYIANHSEIREVIVSGGDPFILETAELDAFLGRVRKIRHVEVLRIGTRTPVVLPMRIDAELCAMLRKHRPLWINTHFNHPSEVTPESGSACERLVESGLPVSNQTVLLKGVNDSFDTLALLFNSLQAICVKPYYLFQCDPVKGAGHFVADIRKGRAIMKKLRESLGGLSVPAFVADRPGARGKIHL